MRLLSQCILVFSGVTLLPVGLFTFFLLHHENPSPGMLLGVALATVVVGGLSAVLSIRYLLHHIVRLLKGILTIAQGELGYQVPVEGKNELSELAHALNYMSTQMKTADEQQKELIATIKRGSLETVRALVSAIHARDPYTRGHTNRVAKLSVLVGKELGVEGDQLLELEYGAILHDIGKIAIRDNILLKPAQLQEAEMAIMRTHPEHGRRILGSVSFLKPVIPLVLYHHERWNGEGYPAQLKGEDIPLGARIIAAADTYDAITTNRPYQAARGFEEAMPIIRRLSGSHLDPRVVEALETAIRQRPYRMYAAVNANEGPMHYPSLVESDADDSPDAAPSASDDMARVDSARAAHTPSETPAAEIIQTVEPSVSVAARK